MVAALLALGHATNAAAEKQIRPFIGATFGGATTLVDLENAVGKLNPVIGVNAQWLGNIAGVDVDFGDAPGFFQASSSHLVLGSRVTTFTGNIVVAAPGRKTEYTLRPYVVGGFGVMRAHMDDWAGIFKFSETMATGDVGGGAVGFVTRTIGVCWEARYFSSFTKQDQGRGQSFGAPEKLSFWRASMALAIRY